MQKLDEDEVGEITSSVYHQSLRSHVLHVTLNNIAKPGVNLITFIIFGSKCYLCFRFCIC